MKTIEERAREYSNKLVAENSYNGYMQGATEQKAIDIDKACEWLKNNLGYYDRHSVYVGKTYEDVVTESFRKAMEDTK